MMRCLYRVATDDDQARNTALDELEDMSPAALAEHVDGIACLLADKRVQVRLTALEVAGMLTPSDLAERALPMVLTTLSNDPNGKVQAAALDTMAKLDHAALAPHAGTIAQYLGTSGRKDSSLRHEPSVRSAALRALAKLDAPLLARHARAIASLVDDHHPFVRGPALSLLTMALPELPLRLVNELAPRALQCLGSRYSGVHAEAARLLGGLPPAALAAQLPALLRLLRIEATRPWALTLLSKLDSALLSAQLPSVLPHLGSSDSVGTRCAALRLLRSCRPAAVDSCECRAALSGCIHDVHRSVRRTALEVVAALPPAARAAQLPGIHRCLDDVNQSIRRLAVELLGAMPTGSLSAPILMTLMSRLTDANGGVRRAALRTLSELNVRDLATVGDHPSLVEFVVDLQRSSRGVAREFADATLRALCAPPPLPGTSAAAAGALYLKARDEFESMRPQARSDGKKPMARTCTSAEPANFHAPSSIRRMRSDGAVLSMKSPTAPPKMTSGLAKRLQDLDKRILSLADGSGQTELRRLVERGAALRQVGDLEPCVEPPGVRRCWSMP